MAECKRTFKYALVFLLLILAGLSTAAPFRYWNPMDTSSVPKTLSAMGLYVDIKAMKKALVPEAHAYEVNTPAWSDDSKPKRWVLLKAGKAIGFREKDDYWDYPDSAVFIKDHDIDTIDGDSASRVHWETQVLMNRKDTVDFVSGPRPGTKVPVMMDHWYGYSYRWNADQKDARLLSVSGKDDSIRIRQKGMAGASRIKKWRFLSRNQCEACHRAGYADTVHGRSLLGFFTAQLNRPHPDSASRNQLEVFFDQGLLKGARPAAWDKAPRWRAIGDESASPDTRARSYVAANCSGCHGARGMIVGATFGVQTNYDFHTMEARMDLRHRTVSWPFGLDDDSIQPKYYPRGDYVNNPDRLDSLAIDPAEIVPGYPQKSVLLFRQLARNGDPGDYDTRRNQMPPLATFEVDVAATNLLKRWILEMGPKIATGVHAPIALSWPAEAAFQGRTLVVSAEALRSRPRISMLNVSGREIPLERLSEGVFALPYGLPKGLYYVRIGGKTLLKSLL